MVSNALLTRLKSVFRYTAAVLAFTGSLSSAQTLIWSEEFNYTAAPDSDVWSHDLGDWGWGNAELQNYTSDSANAWVNGSNLVITAIKQGSGNNATFTSARLKTLDKLTFKYGTVEARIQTPDLANGLWPAFWTLGNDFPTAGWPECGEIDIMEMGIGGAIGAGLVNRRVGSHFHWDNNGSYANYGLSKDMPSDINDTFVVYRMEWTPTEIKTYINGLHIVTMNTASIPEFNAPHFFILNLAVGGTYTGLFNHGDITASFPAEYKVDWIRIFDNGHTVLGGTSQVAPPTPGTNLLTNAGFETGSTGWNLSLGGGSASDSTAYARSGADSLLIDSTGAGDWSSPNASQSFSASAGDVFNMQGYMLNPAGDSITGSSFGLFKIEFRDSGGTLLDPASIDTGTAAGSPWYGAESTPRLNAASATDTWIFSEAQAEAPTGTVEARFVILNVNEPGNLGPMYFDDIHAELLGEPNDPPVFASNLVIRANATEDVGYTGQTLAGEATDPDSDPLSYSLVPGGPVWLNVATNGALSGTPGNEDVGFNNWTVQVSDGNGGTDTATLNITVDNVNDAPVFTTNPIVMPNALEGNAYSDTIVGSATDVDAGASLSYSLVPGGPAWLSVTTNGALSGTPGNGDVGTNSWTVQVSDGIAAPITATLEITVNARVAGLRLLENPGFESGTADWDSNLSGGSAAATWIYMHGGSYSLEIDSTGAGDWASPNVSQSFPASPGDVYHMQGYMLNPSSDPITGSSFGLFKVEFRDSGGAVLEPASVDIGTSAASPYYGAESDPHLNVSSATDTWIFSEVEAEAPTGTATVGFYILNVNQPGNLGSMYFDEIEAIWVNAPVLPVTLSSVMAGGNIQLSFPTQNGISYEVVCKTNLTQATWISIETIIGDGNTNSTSYLMSEPAGFYKILTP